jgi:hypothetical protein
MLAMLSMLDGAQMSMAGSAFYAGWLLIFAILCGWLCSLMYLAKYAISSG